MKALAFGLLAILAASAHADTRATCTSKIATANELAQLGEGQYRDGALGLDSVVGLKLDALDLQYDCRTLTIDTYCSQAQPLAQELVELANQSLDAGAGDRSDVLKAELRQQNTDGRCQ